MEPVTIPVVGQGHWYNDVRSIERELKKKPDDPSLLFQLGGIYRAHKKTDLAFQFYLRAARVFIARGSKSRAMRILELMVRLEPDHAEALELVAQISPPNSAPKARQTQPAPPPPELLAISAEVEAKAIEGTDPFSDKTPDLSRRRERRSSLPTVVDIQLRRKGAKQAEEEQPTDDVVDPSALRKPS